MAGPVERLKQTRWYEPALKKYAAYLNAHSRQRCQGLSVSFSNFVTEILATPERLRDELLKIEETSEVSELARLQNAPRTRYRQYDAPAPKEIGIGLTLRTSKRRK